MVRPATEPPQQEAGVGRLRPIVEGMMIALAWQPTEPRQHIRPRDVGSGLPVCLDNGNPVLHVLRRKLEMSCNRNRLNVPTGPLGRPAPNSERP